MLSYLGYILRSWFIWYYKIIKQGICLSRRDTILIGVDIVFNSINESRKNSLKNNIENSKFYHGKAEDIMPNLISKFSNHRILAIV
jgi:tRNA/tmRNA/rRNA uracil-C5-methylase (TrmA/RlmC/RlmD family)